MNQREKDIEAGHRLTKIYTSPAEDFADGAEYARKELFERIRAKKSEVLDYYVDELAKEYGL